MPTKCIWEIVAVLGYAGLRKPAWRTLARILRQLTLQECAFLAGLIRAPNYYSVSDRHPERAPQARDRVLAQMLENKFVTEDDVQDAKRSPLKLAHTAVVGSEAPYLVDMVKDHLLENYTETELLSQNFRVYTTLDPQLQRAAAVAIESGMKNVDDLLAKKIRKGAEGQGQKGRHGTRCHSASASGADRD